MNYSICGIIVTYQPDSSIYENVLALSQQVEQIVIVDNASIATAREYVLAAANIPGVELISNSTNEGIASALNRGLVFAQARGFDWAATFDQDSHIPAGYIQTLLEGYESYSQREDVIVIAPSYQDEGTGRFVQVGTPTTETVYPILCTMTSGNLLRMAHLGKVGYFWSELFIDYVDHEFCLRCWRLGYQVIECPRARLLHNHGRQSQHRLLGRTLTALNQNAVRRYYIARNRLIIYRHYLWLQPRWVAKDVFNLGKELFMIAYFEADRAAKLRLTARGLWDGLRGKLGAFS